MTPLTETKYRHINQDVTVDIPDIWFMLHMKEMRILRSEDE